jgi:hypothetical protein
MVETDTYKTPSCVSASSVFQVHAGTTPVGAWCVSPIRGLPAETSGMPDQLAAWSRACSTESCILETGATAAKVQFHGYVTKEK